MNFRKSSKQPLTPPPPCFRKSCCKFFGNVRKNLFNGPKSATWIENDPPPFPTFPKIHLFWWGHPYLTIIWQQIFDQYYFKIDQTYRPFARVSLDLLWEGATFWQVFKHSLKYVVALPFVCSRGLFVNVCKKDFIFGTQSDLSTVMAFCFRDSFEARLSKKISSLIIISSVWVRTVLLILPVCLTNLFTLSSSSLYSVTPPVTKLTSASVATATILICESSERPGEDSVWYSPQPSHASRRLGIVLPDSPALPKGTDRLLPERGRGAGSFHVQYLFPVRFPYLSIWCPRNHLFHISISWKPGFWLAPRN